MREFVIRYWLEAIFGAVIMGFGAAYKYLSKIVYKQIGDQKSLRDGTQALLRNQIIHSYDKYMEQGWIPIYGRENVLDMYKAYHALDGNGTITKLMDEIMELPSKEMEKGKVGD